MLETGNLATISQLQQVAKVCGPNLVTPSTSHRWLGDVLSRHLQVLACQSQ